MSRNTAMLLIIAGATCMSFVGLLMRLLETTDGMVILFYRSITLAGMVALVACLRRRQPERTCRASMTSATVKCGIFRTRAAMRARHGSVILSG